MGVTTGFSSRAQHSRTTFYSPQKDKLLEIHILNDQQTLIYQLKIYMKEMKNLRVRTVPLFHGLPLAFWKEKETCPQPLVTVIGFERQDLQMNRHRKEGTS